MNSYGYIRESLPPFLFDDEVFNQIIASISNELDKLDIDTEDLLKQLFPQTCTWSIDLWEEMCGLSHNDTSLEVRRGKVLAKLTRDSPMTPYEMKKIIGNFGNEVLVNSFPKESRFEILLKTKTTIHGVLTSIIDEIEDAKPAHLAYDIIIDYLSEYVVNEFFYRWFSEPIQLCGTIDVSGNQYITTDGWSFKESLSGTISSNRSEELTVVSETTFIVGDGKTLTEALSLNINNYPSNLFKQSAEESFIDGADGKSITSTVADGVSRFYSELIPRAAQDIYVKEVAK